MAKKKKRSLQKRPPKANRIVDGEDAQEFGNRWRTYYLEKFAQAEEKGSVMQMAAWTGAIIAVEDIFNLEHGKKGTGTDSQGTNPATQDITDTED